MAGLMSAAMSQTAVLRILDASLNRAGEGLRVVEDYVRFVLDDPFLTGQAKSLRHDLATAAAAIPTRPIGMRPATRSAMLARDFHRRRKRGGRMLGMCARPASSGPNNRSAAWKNMESW